MKCFSDYHNISHKIKFVCSKYLYSFKINELVQSSQAGVYFFSWIPAENTSVWVKQPFCISCNLSCRYTIDNRIFTTHLGFFGRWQHRYIICLYISPCFDSWSESIAEWLVHSASVSLLKIEVQVRFLRSSGHCEHTNHIVCSINSNWIFAWIIMNEKYDFL